jgi:hypothetical protein
MIDLVTSVLTVGVISGLATDHPFDAPLGCTVIRLAVLRRKDSGGAPGPITSRFIALLVVPRLGLIVRRDADVQAVATTAMTGDLQGSPLVAAEAGEQQQDHQADDVTHARKIRNGDSATNPATIAMMTSLAKAS